MSYDKSTTNLKWMEYGVYKEYLNVLSRITLYLVQDGYTGYTRFLGMSASLLELPTLCPHAYYSSDESPPVVKAPNYHAIYDARSFAGILYELKPHQCQVRLLLQA